MRDRDDYQHSDWFFPRQSGLRREDFKDYNRHSRADRITFWVCLGLLLALVCSPLF